MFYRKAYYDLRREHQRAQLAWEAERANLLDRIMLLAQSPWTLPPEEPRIPVPQEEFPIQPDQVVELPS